MESESIEQFQVYNVLDKVTAFADDNLPSDVREKILQRIKEAIKSLPEDRNTDQKYQNEEE